MKLFRTSSIGLACTALLVACTSVSQQGATKSSCYSDIAVGAVCSGCLLVTGNDPMKICLAVTKDGEIVGDYTAVPDAPGKATLVVRDLNGDMARVEAPFGFDRVQYVRANEGYFVYAANRENDIPKNFDAVFHVAFNPDGPAIAPVITGMGFGEYFERNARWYVVTPQEHPEDLVLRQLDVLGQQMDEFTFGKDLHRIDPDPNLRVAGVHVLDEGNVVVDFWKEGVWKDKGGPFYHMIVSPDQKTVQIAR
ncbi:hypothetical protein EXS70_03315 [Candidatus Peribacteria bacterium]|nr:hypothetical protein [Candidatus Peribacteria bacterium]